MAKSLNDILKGVKSSKTRPGSTGSDPGVDYMPKAKGEQDFVAKHKTEVHADRVGNGDDVYKGKTKQDHTHKSTPQSAYEEFEIDEAKRTIHAHDSEGKVTQAWTTGSKKSAVKAAKRHAHPDDVKYTYGKGEFSRSGGDKDVTNKIRKEEVEDLEEAEKKEPTQHEKHEKVANAVLSHMSFLKKAKQVSEMHECNHTEGGVDCKVHGKKKCPTKKESGTPMKYPSGNVADEGRV